MFVLTVLYNNSASELSCSGIGIQHDSSSNSKQSVSTKVFS